MRRGVVFALSGVDCAGKSTQVKLLLAALRARGDTPVSVYIRPGSTPGLRALKRAARRIRGGPRVERGARAPKPGGYPRRAAHFASALGKRLWLTGVLVDLAWTCCVHLRLLQIRGRSVVCDRYLLDCLVDFRVNFPDERVERGLLYRLLSRCAVRPRAAYCLSVPAALSEERAQAKGRHHWETLAVLEARRGAYVALAPVLGVQLLDGTRPTEELARCIRHGTADTLPARELAPRRLP